MSHIGDIDQYDDKEGNTMAREAIRYKLNNSRVFPANIFATELGEGNNRYHCYNKYLKSEECRNKYKERTMQKIEA